MKRVQPRRRPSGRRFCPARRSVAHPRRVLVAEDGPSSFGSLLPVCKSFDTCFPPHRSLSWVPVAASPVRDVFPNLLVQLPTLGDEVGLPLRVPSSRAPHRPPSSSGAGQPPSGMFPGEQRRMDARNSFTAPPQWRLNEPRHFWLHCAIKGARHVSREAGTRRTMGTAYVPATADPSRPRGVDSAERNAVCAPRCRQRRSRWPESAVEGLGNPLRPSALRQPSKPSLQCGPELPGGHGRSGHP
jgi:hypothetical protein